MISRRNIRIKVFQTIYELAQQYDTPDPQTAQTILDNKLADTEALLAAASHLAFLVSDYVLLYANQKAAKLLPTEADLNINQKLAGNTVMKALRSNRHFEEVIKKHKLSSLFDHELVRTVFQQLIETQAYQDYIRSEDYVLAEDKDITLFILKHGIFQNEVASAFLSEQFQSWYIDAEMIESWFEKLVNNPSHFPFNKLISGEKLNFAHDLLSAYYDKKEIVFQLIEPKLVNWDAERVALIDLILLHLGICEMLYFPTIPVKVTINEYIDLAKSYSTLQSGQFVNGLLDNVHKELDRDQKLHKEHYQKKS
jgi:N utilization substance protein B